MHRVDGDDTAVQVSGVEASKKVPHGRDLVALGVHDVLAQDDAADMVERSDQMRRRTRPGSCAAHRLGWYQMVCVSEGVCQPEGV
jgi:hypothetical protein